MAIFAPLHRPARAERAVPRCFLTAAGLAGRRHAEFLLGTDAVGRDMLSRLIYGARYSLFIGFVVVTLSLVGGVMLGLVAGYFRGWVEP